MCRGEQHSLPSAVVYRRLGFREWFRDVLTVWRVSSAFNLTKIIPLHVTFAVWVHVATADVLKWSSQISPEISLKESILLILTPSSLYHHVACLGRFNREEPIPIQVRPQPISSNYVARLGREHMAVVVYQRKHYALATNLLACPSHSGTVLISPSHVSLAETGHGNLEPSW